ncbi:MAG: choice-of-anchor D domain-containing protein, partial [Saprospiraceae bacterium]|nr:choice-of-anchor D domain-containing protein [Saprospiraceae bacterium]
MLKNILQSWICILLLLPAFSAKSQSAPVWVSNTQSSGDGTTGTVALPASVVDGDLLVLVFSLEKGSAVTFSTAPAGYTAITSPGNTNFGIRVYYKVATAAEPAPSWTYNTSGKWVATLSRITGARTTSPVNIAGAGATGNSTSPNAPAITTTFNDCLILSVYGHKKDGTYSNLPVGLTQVYQVSDQTLSAFMGTFVQGTLGTTVDKTLTHSESENWAAMQIAILPVVTQKTYSTDGVSQFFVPAGVTQLKVDAWGGGGGGGSGSGSERGGGGGGAFASSVVSVTPGTTQTVTVGAAGPIGVAGGTSSFGSFVVAVGGNSTTTYTGALGGDAADCTGTIVFSGGKGGNGNASNQVGGGGGGEGASASGPGNNGGNGGVGNINGTSGGGAGGTGNPGGGDGGRGGHRDSDGNLSPPSGAVAGSAPGGAGGGRSNNTNSFSAAGADGRVTLSWTCPDNVDNMTTTAVTPLCAGNGASVTIGSTTLAGGTYTVYYELSGANVAAAQTVTLVFDGNTNAGTFTTSALSNDGATTVTILSVGCVPVESDQDVTATVTVQSYYTPIAVFTETMGTVTATTTIATHEANNGFTNDGFTMSGTGDVRNSNASSGYTGASGAANIFLSNTGGPTTFLVSGINTTLYNSTSLSLSFGVWKNQIASDGSDLAVEVSSDGTNFTPLTFTALPTTTAIWYSRTATGTIPATSNLRIRFTNTGSTYQYRIDDVSLSGAAQTPDITASGPTDFCAGGSVTLTANGLTSGWLWSDGITTTQSLPVNASGAYSVILTAANTCTASAGPVNVTVYPLPTITTSGTVTATCPDPGDQTTGLPYSATMNDPVTYSIDWNAAANSAGLADQGSTAFVFAAGGGTVNNIDVPGGTNLGSYSGTMTIATAHGCTATQAVSLLVGDAEPPEITCPSGSPFSRNVDAGECSYMIQGTEFDPEAFSDNCPGATVSNTFNNMATLAGSDLPKGSTSITWTVTDALNMLTTACVITVTVTDNEVPTISCPSGSPFAKNTDPGQCNYTVSGAEFDPTVFDDNCAGATISNNFNNTSTLSGDDLPKGSTTITWTVTDATNVNSAFCQITVVVSDNEAPTITCPSGSPFVRNSDAGQCNYTVQGAEFDPTVFGDNCPGSTISNDFNSANTLNGTDLPTGNTTVTWTVTDGMVATSCQITVTVLKPEIDVQGNNVPIAAGDATPSTSDHTDFGLVATGSNGVRTFTIMNTGTANLTVSGISSNNTRFTVGTLTPASPIPAGQSATFTVTFNPNAVGAQNATITINNNDCNEAVYDFAVTGTGFLQGAALAFGAANDFVNVNYNLNQSSLTLEAWVKPTSAARMYVICNDKDGFHGAGFAVNNYQLEIDCHNTFTGAPGTLFSNGVWAHVAVVYQPDARVRAYVNGTEVYNAVPNTTWTASMDGLTNFSLGRHNPSNTLYYNGSIDEVRVWERSLCQAEIQAQYNCELTGSEPNLAVYFKFNQGIADDNNAGLTTLNDLAGTAQNGTLTNFTLSGSSSNWTAPGGVTTGASCSPLTVPEINVQGNSTNIVDGDNTPSSTDHTDFDGNLSRTFTVQNTAVAAALTVSSITSSNPKFVIGALSPVSPVAASGTATFTVTYNPTDATVQTATITVNNDDCDEAVYDFVVTATAA